MKPLMLLAGAAVLAFSSAALAQTPLFPDIAEIDKASPETAEFFEQFFTAKSLHDVDATMAFFSPELLTYTDAILGWPFDNLESLRQIFATYMPNWGDGRSYPVRILGGPDSAVVEFVDTPELFGGELRVLGVIDIKDGKIVRWIDYWDSTSFPAEVYEKSRTPAASFPTDFKDGEIANQAPPLLTEVATELQAALAKGDVATILPLLSYDVVYEDMVSRSLIRGRAAVGRYLERVDPVAAFGKGSELIHIAGGALGGGFEWRSADKAIRGVTALELDAEGRVTRITTTYDGRLLSPEARSELVQLALELE